MKKILWLLLIIGFTFHSETLANIEDAKPLKRPIQKENNSLPVNVEAVEPLEIVDPWIRPAQKGQNAILVMKIVNTSNKPNKLISVKSSVTPTIEFHDHQTDNGRMQMRKLAFFQIPAHGNLFLGSGKEHIMLRKLSRDLKVGEIVHITMQFENGKNIELRVPVKAR